MKNCLLLIMLILITTVVRAGKLCDIRQSSKVTDLECVRIFGDRGKQFYCANSIEDFQFCTHSVNETRIIIDCKIFKAVKKKCTKEM